MVRAAADFIFAGATSGAFLTNLMLGMRTIPIYTQYSDTEALGGLGIQDISDIRKQKERFVPFFSTFTDNYKKALEIVTPLNIEATDMLCERIYDTEYWDSYNDNLSEIQLSIFGKYYVGNAAKKAAMYIKNFINYGTLANAELFDNKKTITGTLTIKNSTSMIF